MSIKRFQCVAEHVHPGYTVASMRQCDDGDYVRYERHAEIVSDLERQLYALKSMQKSDLLKHVHPIFEKACDQVMAMMVQKAIEESEKMVRAYHEMFKMSVKVDESKISEISVEEAFKRWTENNGGVVLTDAFIKAGSIQMGSIRERYERETVKPFFALLPNVSKIRCTYTYSNRFKIHNVFLMSKKDDGTAAVSDLEMKEYKVDEFATGLFCAYDETGRKMAYFKAVDKH